LAEKITSQVGQFVDFVREQGVVGLAVGLAVGVAAKEAIDAIVTGLINPLVGFILGGANLTELTWNTGLVRGGEELVFAWGTAANAMITLIAVAAVVFFVIRSFGLDKLDKKKERHGQSA